MVAPHTKGHFCSVWGHAIPITLRQLSGFVVIQLQFAAATTVLASCIKAAQQAGKETNSALQIIISVEQAKKWPENEPYNIGQQNTILLGNVQMARFVVTFGKQSPPQYYYMCPCALITRSVLSTCSISLLGSVSFLLSDACFTQVHWFTSWQIRMTHLMYLTHHIQDGTQDFCFRRGSIADPLIGQQLLLSIRLGTRDLWR